MVGLLLALNIGVWAWTQNHLAALGLRAPTRLSRAALAHTPIAPERIQSPAAQSAIEPLQRGDLAVDPGAMPTQWACWRLGPFAGAQQTELQRVLPLSSAQVRWSVLESSLPQRWVVASERAASAQALAALQAKAAAQAIDHRISDTEVLRGRLILGTFVNRDLAVNALSTLLEKDWGALSVLRERPAVPALLLQVQVADETALASVKAALAPIPVLGQSGLQSQRCSDSDDDMPPNQTNGANPA